MHKINENMKLSMDESVAEDYKNASQITRVISENWFNREMYCPNCTSGNLEKLEDNTKVKDFTCPNCEEDFQLKASSRGFGNKVTSAAYEPQVKSIKKGESPNWVFLSYDKENYVVEDLMIVPSYFMTLDIIEARRPLSNSAKRSGWVGSKILLGNLPDDARLYIVNDGEVKKKEEVREQWEQFHFMKNQSLSAKGWTNDVLKCVGNLCKKEFTLQEMYDFEEHLQELHPENDHVRDKIRQQLQKLRDEEVLEFIDNNGKYRVL